MRLFSAGFRDQLAKALRRLKPAIHIDRGTAKASRRHRPIGRLLPALEQRVGTAAASADAWEELVGADAKAALAIGAWRATPALTSISPVELAELAEYALSGPGVIAGRALLRHAPDALDAGYPALIKMCWQGLRAYLDNPVMLAALGGNSSVDGVMRGAREGNLESVLDEHFWLQSQTMPKAEALADDLRGTLTLVAGGFNFHPIGGAIASAFAVTPPSPLERPKQPNPNLGWTSEHPLGRTRCERASTTPFWPHVLVTTSVGQEGLNFILGARVSHIGIFPRIRSIWSNVRGGFHAMPAWRCDGPWHEGSGPTSGMGMEVSLLGSA